MKKNQKGFSAVVVLLFVVVIGLVGGTGWYVWQSNKKNNPNSSSSNLPEPASSNKKDSSAKKAKIDTTITDVDITLEVENDIKKLPAATPISFKAYMLEKLKNNKPADGCIQKFSVSKISFTNIKGGANSVNSSSGSVDDNCFSGAPILWVLTPAGTWDEESLNGPMCKSKKGGLVYEEFVPECYVDSNTDTLVKNPNGSIKSLEQ